MSVHPLEYLSPFLKLVREPDVSGPITGVALTALWRLLSSGAVAETTVGAAAARGRVPRCSDSGGGTAGGGRGQGVTAAGPALRLEREGRPAAAGVERREAGAVLGGAAAASEAVNAIVEDTTQCKFEATSPSSDEVLQAVVKCPAGVGLSDDSVCKAYQAAFMLGNLDADTRGSKGREVSELLTHYSRQIMGEITTVIFSRCA
ncbi:hypothetical protein MNEG_12126 [Monoraphidium neglectum]|uniref:Uncharacterized protein n=1 Tax=Monoraphidium neglectum TaxID=145388 RepID=A0A0D2MM05_9CHLO|nr:hypothetical protein MNEG_12126 [Monoraphidium neglectum]KIY95835.1 hypothetical protein MNEG_12126 [Monoraphidium neglectum]|eukprot:XP_013894855.1 hypothetical protein MNEG_12126 [Monoraphidium neglectum]